MENDTLCDETSTLVDALGRLDADAEQAVWTRLARQLSLDVLIGPGGTRLTLAAHSVEECRQTARHYTTDAHTHTHIDLLEAVSRLECSLLAGMGNAL